MKKLTLVFTLFFSMVSFANDFGCFFAKKNLKSSKADTEVTKDLNNYCDIEKPFSIAAALNDTRYSSDKKIMICCHIQADQDLKEIQSKR